MKISVITVTLNNSIALEKTIKSVMEQTYSDIEHIIIDGGSIDGSLAIIKRWQQRFPDKIKYVSEADSGVYNAINKGIALATGDIIGLLHGNDFFSSDGILAQMVEKMNETKAPMIYGDIHYINPQDGNTVRNYSARDFSPEMLRKGIAPPHPSLYLRREIFKRHGVYKEDYRVAADFEMFVRLMLVNDVKAVYLPADMVTMTTGGLSTRLRHRLITNTAEKYRALKENGIKTNLFTLLMRYFYILKNK